jgi:hypothetical protein
VPATERRILSSGADDTGLSVTFVMVLVPGALVLKIETNVLGSFSMRQRNREDSTLRTQAKLIEEE